MFAVAGPGFQAVLRPHEDVDAASLQLGTGAAVQEQRLTLAQPVQDGRFGHGSSRAHGTSQNTIAVSDAYAGMRMEAYRLIPSNDHSGE